MPKRVEARHFCLVCGEPGKSTGCCGDPLCRSILWLYPELKDGINVHKPTKALNRSEAPRKSQRTAKSEELKTVRQITIPGKDNPITPKDDLAAHPDPRPEYRAQGRQISTPWASVTPKMCLFREQANREDQISLRLEVARPTRIREQIVRQLGGKEYLREYDYILAWRCGCEARTEKYYKRISDIPAKLGRSGVCPVCNSAALVIVLKEDH